MIDLPYPRAVLARQVLWAKRVPTVAPMQIRQVRATKSEFGEKLGFTSLLSSTTAPALTGALAYLGFYGTQCAFGIVVDPMHSTPLGSTVYE